MAIVEREMVGDGILKVTLNDPDRYNALTPALIDGLDEVFASIRHDRDVRVVILAGNGRGFCAGADMSGTGGVTDRARGRGRRPPRTGPRGGPASGRGRRPFRLHRADRE